MKHLRTTLILLVVSCSVMQGSYQDWPGGVDTLYAGQVNVIQQSTTISRSKNSKPKGVRKIPA